MLDMFFLILLKSLIMGKRENRPGDKEVCITWTCYRDVYFLFIFVASCMTSLFGKNQSACSSYIEASCFVISCPLGVSSPG